MAATDHTIPANPAANTMTTTVPADVAEIHLGHLCFTSQVWIG